MKFASLFSGCGGFDLGFMENGFEHLAAYEVDKNACENFSANIDSEIHQCDLSKEFPDSKRLNNIDVLLAGPPCQGFSTAGKRDVDDVRNNLVTLTGKLALEISPKVLIVENVPGVLSGKHRRYWEDLEAMMKNGGYQTNTVVCSTEKIGMAQSRKRVLMFAWNTGGDSSFQLPQFQSLTLRQAISGVRGLKNHKPKRLVEGSKDWLIAKKIKPGQKLSNVRGGDNSVATWNIPEVFGETTESERTILELLKRLRRQERTRAFGDADPVSLGRLEIALGKPFIQHLHSLIAKGYVKEIDGRVDLIGTFNGKYRRLRWDGYSSTVDTRFGSPRYFLHPRYQRGFTVREAARLQGFKDDFVFFGSEQAQYRAIGNAVPPPLGHLASVFAKELLGVGSECR